MSQTASDVKIKRIEAQPVLSVRRIVKGQPEVQSEIAALREGIEELMTGPPICRIIGPDPQGRLHVEIAFPVAEPLQVIGFRSDLLPEMDAFAIEHLGPLTEGPEGTQIRDTVNRMLEYLRSKGPLIGDEPIRYVYHEGAETHGESFDAYRTEVQLPYHLPAWLRGLEQGVRGAAGEAAAQRVMAGSEGLADALDAGRTAEWVAGAVQRLEQEIAEEPVRACVLHGCSHRYLIQSAEGLWAKYEQSGDLRQLVEQVNADGSLAGTYTIDESGPDPLLIIERRPARPQAYAQAEDPNEKRYLACFCPLVRDAIRRGEKGSRTFCHCSGGWYVQEWEPIFGERPRVEVLRTMLEGEDSCIFAVHIPSHLLD